MTGKFSTITFPELGLEMNPPMGFELFGLQIRFYGIAIALGLLLAVIYGLRRSKKFGLKEDDILDGVLCIVPFAILCARAYYVIFQWEAEFAGQPWWSVFAIWKGGLAIPGGIIGAALGVIVFGFVKKVRVGAVLDLVAISFLLGQSIGRWGNFFNREAFGEATESFFRMGLTNAVTGEVTYHHPTFFYESLWNLAGFVLLHFLSKKRKFDGQMALGYAAWYGFGRTFIEALRTDALMEGDVRVTQVLAAVACFLSAVVLVVAAFRKWDPEKLFVNQVNKEDEEIQVEILPAEELECYVNQDEEEDEDEESEESETEETE